MPGARVVLLVALIGCAATLGRADEVPGQGENKIPAAVREALDKAEGVTLLSLDPDEKAGVGAPVQFHDWKVLGKTEVKDKAARAKLIAALVKGANQKGVEAAKCFEPRHGLQFTRGGKTVDLVICFQCSQVRVYVNGSRGEGFLIANSPQPAFDQVLKDAGVPLPTN
jgi:hypothetical protein